MDAIFVHYNLVERLTVTENVDGALWRAISLCV